MSVQAPKVMKLLKAKLEGVARLIRVFRLRERDVAAKPTFARLLVQVFNEDFAE